MNDKQLKEKMESLDALSGGIVFGKEEAWDKLQSRMDAKPARKIVLWYRLVAAAAVLLLFISIAYIYNTPEKEIAQSQPPSPVIQEIETAPATTIAITDPQPEMIVPQEKAARKHEQQPVNFVIKEEQPAAQQEPQDMVVPQPAIVNVVPPVPTKPSVKKMRVVHINELGNYEEEPAYAAEHNSPSLDIRKMKVVSIYDVQHEGRMWQPEDIPVIVRINRPHVGGFALPYSIKNTPYNQPFAQNPLSIRLNRNN